SQTVRQTNDFPLSRPAVRPLGRRVAVHASGDGGEYCHSRTSRKIAAPREGRGAARVAYTEIDSPVLGLAAYSSRLADPPWTEAGLRRQPADRIGARHRQVALGVLVAGLIISSLALAAEFLHPGSNGGEVVSSAGPVHGVSSLRLGLVLAAAR